MKKILSKVWMFLKLVFSKVNEKTKELIPVAINVVEGIKKVMDSPVDDVILSIVKDAIPGDADDILIDKITEVVEKWIPKVFLELQLVETITNTEDIDGKLKIVLSKLKLSSDETQSIFYHGLASLILEKLSDGKITWSEAVVISEFYFKNKIK